MDKDKEINKRNNSDGKKVNISKAAMKNNYLGIKSNTPRKFSYISRSKNVSIPFDNKKYIYSDSKSFLKQSCDKCKIGSHMSLKPQPPVGNVEAGHDLNGNLSFNQHSSFCNFPSVSEVPNFGLSYQAQQRYDLSVQKTSRHRKSGYHDKRAFNSKTTSSSKVPFHTNKFFSPVPHSSISYQNSKGGSLSNSMPFVKFPTNRVCGDASTEKYPRCYVTTHILRDPYLQGNVRIDDPFFAPSLLPDKSGFNFQEVCNLKSDYFIHNWQQISVSSLFENSAKDTSEQVKSLECTDCVIPSVLPESSVICASYADVIRMSPACADTDSEKQDLKSQESHYNQNTTVVNLEKPSFYNSTLQNKNISPQSEIKGDNFENVDKMSSSSSAYSSSFPSDSTTSMIDSSKPDSMYSSASSVSSSINVPAVKKPVINMDPQITFGIEYDEMVKLCFDDCDPDKASVHSENAKSNNQAISDEIKLVKTKLLFNEKELYWEEPNVKYCEDNHIELTNYFASLWKECERNSDSEPSQSQDIKIYQEP